MFTQLIDPLGNLTLTCLVALIPVVSLLVLLAVFRWPAWLAVLAGSIITIVLAMWVWKMPADDGSHAYVYGAATGVWSVDWITVWGMVLFNTLGISGVFENFRRWLIAQGSMDVRVQTMLFAWAFGALLEGLVGFGYPWAVVAPILISLGISDLNAIRVAAIANNAPVSYGALGAPIIALAAVTGYPLLALSASVGSVVAVLALLPPWVLLYLVSGKEGMKGGWPLAVVGSLGYIAGQYPVAVYLGPYLPDVTGSIVCFIALLLLLKFWQPKTVLGYGGVPVDAAMAKQTQGHGLSFGQVLQCWMPFAVLLIVVAAWTGPWSPLPKITWFSAKAVACSATAVACSAAKNDVSAVFRFAPYIGGTGILGTGCRVAAGNGQVEARPDRRGIPQNVPSDVGCLPGRRVHLWAGLCVQFFRHGSLAREGLFEHGHGLHHRLPDTRLHRRRALRFEYLDERHVRQVPGPGRRAARHAAAAAADAQLRRRGNRQARGSPNRERRRLDQQVRAQGRRCHPPQHGLDIHSARLSDHRRRHVLRGETRGDEPVNAPLQCKIGAPGRNRTGVHGALGWADDSDAGEI
jgi:hypothetical protein